MLARFSSLSRRAIAWKVHRSRGPLMLVRRLPLILPALLFAAALAMSGCVAPGGPAARSGAGQASWSPAGRRASSPWIPRLRAGQRARSSGARSPPGVRPLLMIELLLAFLRCLLRSVFLQTNAAAYRCESGLCRHTTTPSGRLLQLYPLFSRSSSPTARRRQNAHLRPRHRLDAT